MPWGESAGGSIEIPARHRGLVVEALRLLAAHKRGQATSARKRANGDGPEPDRAGQTLTAVTRSREASDAEALARDVECGR
jgi:hypothetical protein